MMIDSKISQLPKDLQLDLEQVLLRIPFKSILPDLQETFTFITWEELTIWSYIGKCETALSQFYLELDFNIDTLFWEADLDIRTNLSYWPEKRLSFVSENNISYWRAIENLLAKVTSEQLLYNLYAEQLKTFVEQTSEKLGVAFFVED